MPKPLYLRGKNLWYPLTEAGLGPTAVVDILEKRKICCPCQIQTTPHCPTHSVVTVPTVLSRLVKTKSWEFKRWFCRLPRTGGFVASVLGGKPTTSCCEGVSMLGNVMHAICVISYMRMLLLGV